MKRIAYSIALAAILCMGLCTEVSQPARASDSSAAASFVIRLSFAPSTIEAGAGTYRIGHIQLVSNLTGDPVIASRNVQIDLKSQNPEIVSVPATTIVPQGSDYANFDVTVGRAPGTVQITAAYGAEIVKQSFKVTSARSQIPDNIELVINAASSNMQVGTKMPFSVYLENAGVPVQAPQDITVDLQYETALVQLSAATMVIKRGDYYATGTVTALQTAGNAYIKASATAIQSTAVQSIMVSQTNPAALKVEVFPKKVVMTEGTIDVFVGLLDSSGQPTLATNDVRLTFFSSSSSVLGLDKMDAYIKKGEHGYYARLSTLFFAPDANVTIGASASGLGVGSDVFHVYSQAIAQDNSLASNPVVQVFTVGGMPGEATSAVIYQVMASNVTMGGSDKLYPIQVNQFYSAQTGNLNIVSSDNTLARIMDAGAIGAGHSYGMATIQSGRKTGNVVISASLSNVAFGTSSLTVTSALSPVQTKIFSPSGSMADGTGRLLFNSNGNSDLFFITEDSSSRPATSELGGKYLVQPVNDLAVLAPGTTFVGMNVSRLVFSSSNATAITATPVGVNSDPELGQSSIFKPIFFTGSMAQPILPFSRLIGFTKTHNIGAVQLVDPEGNPVLASRDISVTLSSTVDGAVQSSPLTIKAGSSFSVFGLVTSGREGKLTITASAKDIESGSASVEAMLADMPGRFVAQPTLVATIPGNISVAAPADTSILWGYSSNMQIITKDGKASIPDIASGLYIANIRVKSPSAGNVTLQATLVKDGYATKTLTESVAFSPPVSSLIVLLDSSLTQLTYGIPTPVTVSVRDGFGNPVPGALVSVPGDSNGQAIPSSVISDSMGKATFSYLPAAGIKSASIQVTASKDGFTGGSANLQLGVDSGGISGMIASVLANTPLAALPPLVALIVLVALSGGVGGAAFVIYRRYKPATKKFEMPEVEEGDEEEEVEEET